MLRYLRSSKPYSISMPGTYRICNFSILDICLKMEPMSFAGFFDWKLKQLPCRNLVRSKLFKDFSWVWRKFINLSVVSIFIRQFILRLSIVTPDWDTISITSFCNLLSSNIRRFRNVILSNDNRTGEDEIHKYIWNWKVHRNVLISNYYCSAIN